ETLEDSVF
nr:Chain B, INTERLEUKIN 5 RECEPTOR ALPHA [Homo sapiens]1OBZ_P Chain P, INTERLEUKIN 5 RECEPTOR ALPHA [Homo sapiens]